MASCRFHSDKYQCDLQGEVRPQYGMNSVTIPNLPHDAKFKVDLYEERDHKIKLVDTMKISIRKIILHY